MKPTIVTRTMQGILMGLAICFLFSCKKQFVEVTSPPVVTPPVTEEATRFIGEAIVADPPAFGDVREETAGLPFPKSAEPNARVAAGVTDFVDFDDELALTIIPDQASYTFATSPFYIQQVGSAWIHVKENNSGNYNPAFMSNYGHFHLSYQNFAPCLRDNGKFGKPSGGSCLAINPVKEPRVLDTHYGDEWIKVYAYDYNSPKRVYDLLGIKVTNGPIQLWFRKNNGGWFKWSSIGVGTWNLSAYSTDINEVLIAGIDNNSIGFDNLKIQVPNF